MINENLGIMALAVTYNLLHRVVHAVAISLILVTCAAASGCINDKKHTPESTTLVNVGDQAPDFTVELLDGRSTTLSSLHGEVVMLIFFSTECPDCQNQFAEIQRMVAEKEPSFKVLAISRGESEDATYKFSQKYGITFDVGIDPSRAIYDSYASRYVPRNFLIGPTGRVEALTIEYKQEELHAIWAKAEQMSK